MPKKQTLLDSPTVQKIRHLLVVITDANSEQEYLVVPIDTWKHSFQDDSCILDVGDHPFIKHKSFVNYKFARVISFAKLYNGIQRGVFIRKEDVSEEVLLRIQEGAKITRNLRTELKAWFEYF